MTRENRPHAGGWLMLCDNDDCDTEVGPFRSVPDLKDFAEAGWFIAASYGDACPTCLAKRGAPRVKAHADLPNPLHA